MIDSALLHSYHVGMLASVFVFDSDPSPSADDIASQWPKEAQDDRPGIPANHRADWGFV